MPPDSNADEVDLYNDVILPAVRIVYQRFRVAMSTKALNFARDTSRVDVEFGARWLAMDRSVREDPPAQDLPVLMPRGGGYGVYFDMRPGDMGLAIACDGPVRGFYESGEPTTPQFPQMHDYGCAVVLPGGRVSSTEVPTPPPNDAGTLLVGADDSTASIALRGAGLPTPTELGSMSLRVAGPVASLTLGSDTAAIPVACATQVSANLDALNTTIQAIPLTGNPITDAAITAVKGGFTAAFALFVDIADAKARVDGPVGP
jgi:hypothetical protein